MFLFVAHKVSDETGNVFVNPHFGFHEYRTPVTREEKGMRAKQRVTRKRQVKHKTFTLIDTEKLKEHSKKILVYENVSGIK